MRLWLRVPIVIALAFVFMWLGAWWSTHHSITDEAIDHGCSRIVMVSKVDIPPETELIPLIDRRDVVGECVPSSVEYVEGAATSIENLRDRTTSATISTGEQITVMRLDHS
jgi:hypothetical protein